MSFDPGLRAALESARTKGNSVALRNCHVKAVSGYSRGREREVEIMTTSQSEVESSSRKFEISRAAVDEAPALVQLSDVDGLV